MKKEILLVGFSLLVIVINTEHSLAKEITQERLLSCTNAIRAEFNLKPLEIKEKLTIAAYEKIFDMAENKYWAHHNPITKKKAWEFIDEAGYNYTEAGENLAIGFYYAEDICEAWKNSPAHRENLLKPSFRDIGFGIKKVDLGNDVKGQLVVQFFGKEYNPLQSLVSSITAKNLHKSAEKCGSKKIPNLNITWPPCKKTLSKIDKLIIYNPEKQKIRLELNNNPWVMKSIFTHGDFTRYNPQISIENGLHSLNLQSSKYPEIKQSRDLFVKNQRLPNRLITKQIEIMVLDSDTEKTKLQVELTTRGLKTELLKFQKMSLLSKNGKTVIQETDMMALNDNKYYTQFEIPRIKLKELNDYEFLFKFKTIDNQALVSRGSLKKYERLGLQAAAEISALTQKELMSFSLFFLGLMTIFYIFWRRKE